MRGFRIIWRAIRDTFEHILPFMLASIVWWLLIIVPLFVGLVMASVLPPVIGDLAILIAIAVGFGPATTVLAKWVDPRLTIRRPEPRDAMGWLRRYAVHSWIVAAWLTAVLGILGLNLIFYAAGSNAFALLTPLWGILLIITTMVTFISLAMVSLTDATPREAFRRTGFVIASAPFQSLLLFLFIVLISVIGTVSVVGVVLIVPPLIMAAVDRLVLNQLRIEIPDPNAPTEERLVERKTGDREGQRQGRRGVTRRR